MGALLLTGCELPEELTGVKESPAPPKSESTTQKTTVPTKQASSTQAPVPDEPSLEEMGDASAHGAWRCGECHDTMQEEWSESRHAQSSKSPVYQAMKKLSGSDSCDGCHTPLSGLPGAEKHIVDEGVTCDVCHRIESANPSRSQPGFSLRKAHDIKYGPFCDANQRYFHKSECRPYFEQSGICGTCHLWHMETSSGAVIPVYTEFDDWKSQNTRKQCQDCHMPGTKRSAAVSEKLRDDVANHSFLGKDGSLRGSALDLDLTVDAKGDFLRATGRIENARAGHFLPAGMAGRQLVLRLCATNAPQERVCEEVLFERKVVNEEGARVPFFSSVRVAADTRLKAKSPRSVKLNVTSKDTQDITVSLVDRRFAPEVAKQMKLEPSETIIFSKEFARGDAETASWKVKFGE